jgi:exodeoxyribonuclease V alpha subunit
MVNNFSGILKKIYRRNSYTGKASFGIETDEIDVRRNRYGQVECQGIIPNWPEEIQLEVTGEWDTSETIFIIKTARPGTPTEALSKTLIKKVIQDLKDRRSDFKVGNTLPKKILEISGPDVLRYINSTDSLDELTSKLKIDEWKTKAIFDSLSQLDCSYLTEFVSKFGGSIIDCENLMKKYGKNALKRLRANPYQVGRSIGMDFYVIDAIGRSKNIDPLSHERVKGLIYEAVDQLLYKNGATYCIQSMLKKQVNSLARKSSYPEDIIPGPMIAVKLQSMYGLKVDVVKNGVRVYRKDFYQQECIIAKNLARLLKSKKKLLSDEVLEQMIKKRESDYGMEYSTEQKGTYEALKTTGVKIITGGPGVGKTTVINGLIHSYIEAFPANKIALAAPTGRAAQRMWDVTTIEAKTIHKLIDYLPFEKEEMQVARNEECPIDADCIVIDEMSMVDTQTFAMLLPAIKNASLVLLLGDKNQLQSVSPGNILHDLIKSECFEVYTLTKVYRQKGKSTIIENAYKILDGKMNFIKDDKFMIEYASDDKTAINLIKQCFTDWYKDSGLKNIQILTPIKGSECGTYQINKQIASLLEGSEPVEKFFYGRTTFKEGDKVIFHKNNYTLNYYNGDIGYVSRIIKDGIEVEVGKEIIKVTGEALKEVTLAYAITMHKSQGSEFEDVIVFLPDTYSNMLTRNLLFTAITRAKNRVKIIYINSALSDSVHTITVDKRYTGLVEKVRKAIL